MAIQTVTARSSTHSAAHPALLAWNAARPRCRRRPISASKIGTPGRAGIIGGRRMVAMSSTGSQDA